MLSRICTSTLVLTAVAAALACSPSRNRTDTGQLDSASATRDSSGTVGGASQNVPAKPNAQMQAVLDQLAALHPKPITELSAPVARKQPSPADAVKALLRKKVVGDVRPEPVGSVVNRTIPGAGGPIPIRLSPPPARVRFRSWCTTTEADGSLRIWIPTTHRPGR